MGKVVKVEVIVEVDELKREGFKVGGIGRKWNV